jgi:cyclic pyranopterin phosphate synthase
MPTSRRRSPTPLTHVDEQGRVRMVDVGGKPVTDREAVARGRIRIGRAALARIRSGRIAKGDPLHAARLAGIMAAKRTSELVPLCHPLPLTSIAVDLVPRPDGYEIESRVKTTAQTGVEMEALTAVAVAALTVYDMVKAVDRKMTIDDIRLIEKRGGTSGRDITPAARAGSALRGSSKTRHSAGREGERGRR